MKYRVVKLVNGLYQVQDTYYGHWDLLSITREISVETWILNRKGFTTEKEALDVLDNILTLSGQQKVAEVIHTHPKPFLQRLFGKDNKS